jgi:hypothetical protein
MVKDRIIQSSRVWQKAFDKKNILIILFRLQTFFVTDSQQKLSATPLLKNNDINFSLFLYSFVMY